jgi:hypothetical protein
VTTEKGFCMTPPTMRSNWDLDLNAEVTDGASTNQNDATNDKSDTVFTRKYYLLFISWYGLRPSFVFCRVRSSGFMAIPEFPPPSDERRPILYYFFSSKV